jgi:hypothetical protein
LQLAAAREVLARKRRKLKQSEEEPVRSFELASFFNTARFSSTGIHQRCARILADPATTVSRSSTCRDYAKSREYMLQTRCGREPTSLPYTWAAEASAAGAPKESLQNRFVELAALVDISSRISWTRLLRRCLQLRRRGEISILLFLRALRSDATPVPLRVDDDIGKQVENLCQGITDQHELEDFKRYVQHLSSNPKRKQIAKVVQTELKCTLLIEEIESKRLLNISGEIPCPLQLVDHGTAETLTKAEDEHLVTVSKPQRYHGCDISRTHPPTHRI